MDQESSQYLNRLSRVFGFGAIAQSILVGINRSAVFGFASNLRTRSRRGRSLDVDHNTMHRGARTHIGTRPGV
jgi:hypothetical protein